MSLILKTTHTRTRETNLIKIIDVQENKGAGHARKVGLENTSGNIIIFIDSDDLILDKKFLNKIAHYFNQNKDISVVRYELTTFDTHTKMPVFENKILNHHIRKLDTEYFFSESSVDFIPTPCCAFKKEIFHKNKFLLNEINLSVEDYYFFSALLSLNLTCLITNEVFYGYRINNQNSLTWEMLRKQKEDSKSVLKISEKWFTSFDDFNIYNSETALDMYIFACINPILINGYKNVKDSIPSLPSKQQIINFCQKYKFSKNKKARILILKMMVSSTFFNFLFSLVIRIYRNFIFKLKVKN